MQLRRYRYKLKVKSKGKEQKLRIFAGTYRLIYNLGLLQREFLWWQRRKRTTYAKKNHVSFRYSQGVKISGNRIYLPKIGWFRIFLSREIPKDAEIGEVTVLKEADGWYAEDTGLVGIDMGIRDFACLSDRTKIGHPHVLEKWLKKLIWEQRKLARKKKFSKKWKRQAKRVAKVMQKIARIRHDFLHKISTIIISTIIAKRHGVAVEELKDNIFSMEHLY